MEQSFDPSSEFWDLLVGVPWQSAMGLWSLIFGIQSWNIA